MRLVKYLSTSGVASRRSSETIIASGRVTVNGRTIIDPAFSVEDKDEVTVNGDIVNPNSSETLIYLMFNKPEGVVSTMSLGDEQGIALTDYIDLETRVYPVGRLDRSSSGLMILTNDGNMTQKLTHPSHEIEKEYLIKLSRSLARGDYIRIKKGLKVEGRTVEIDKMAFTNGGRIYITIHEGRKRIIRRLFQTLGYRIIQLKRERIGPIHLGRLTSGHWRYLTDIEKQSLFSITEE